MKSKALLILPPGANDFNKYKVPSWNVCRIPPIGLISIATYLDSRGQEVRVVDCRELIVRHKTNDYVPIILKIIEDFNPDMVGLNVMTAAFNEAKKISDEIRKKFPKIFIVLGGAHPSIEPILTFKQILSIDAICVGPGEEVCFDILDGKNPINIPGLMCRDYSNSFEKRKIDLNIDKYPFLNYDLVDYSYYTEFTIDTTIGWGFKSLAALTSRSCPYSCNFCATSWSRPFRYHSAEYVIELAKRLAKYDIDVVSFFDDTLISIKDRLSEICEGFVRSKLFWPNTNKKWYANARANEVDSESLKLMKKAGCFGVAIGIESGSDRMLEVINKRSTIETNKRACNYVKEAGLFLGASFIIGIPGETENEMEKTLSFARDIDCNSRGVGVFRPLPGSPFYYNFVNDKILIKEKIDWADLGNFSAPSKYLFSKVSFKTLEKIWVKAVEIMYGNRWTAIHEDALLKYPNKIKEIASNARVKIAKSGEYNSSSHIPYVPFSFRALYIFYFSIFWNLIPFKIRVLIRSAIIKIRRKYASFNFSGRKG
jgi:anaerobic magnesium-protoporphyrin IX monomethyl ester cyclase